MNTKKQFLSIFLLILAVNNQELSAAAGAAMEAGLSDFVNQTIPQELLIPLDKYNAHYNNNFAISINHQRIQQFLNEELRKNQLNPNDFQYFVVTDNDWQIIQTLKNFLWDGKYALIIPDFSSTYGSLMSSLLSSNAKLKSSYNLNVRGLDEALRDKNSHELSKYRLAIVKAIVAAQTKNILQAASSAWHQGAFASLGKAAEESFGESTKKYLGKYARSYLGKTSDMIHPHLGMAAQIPFLALSSIYPMMMGNQEAIEIQKNLDDYILRSYNRELIQAYIENLEQQLTEEQNSITTKLWNYIPYSQKTKSPLEERIDIIKNFLTDNNFELRLMESGKK